MTGEECLRCEDMGNYFRVSADNRDLNYDKFFVKGEVQAEAGESYTSHNTNRLDIDGVVRKILTTDYVKEALEKKSQYAEEGGVYAKKTVQNGIQVTNDKVESYQVC